MLKRWKELSDKEKIESLRSGLDRLRVEVAEIGADVRSARTLAETIAKAMVVLQRKSGQRDLSQDQVTGDNG
jgi:hypothetical protein